ncbi:ankyrin [Karstenula rhodostoma CBS 690.94]|uniref:Ankyrin n=1 Tax=Karstenula rhodostoma CBS 690.94 TaxID=1392251 RepID=A0A9P4PZE0_9PLEO|nr:ankyrin [Karstenula rhodostoma CBS 690.94]
MEAVKNQFGSLFLRYTEDKAIWPSTKEAGQLLEKGADPNMGYRSVVKIKKDREENSSTRSLRFPRALLPKSHKVKLNGIEGPLSPETFHEAIQIGYSNPPQWQYPRGYILPLIIAVSHADIDMVRTLGEHCTRFSKRSLDQFGEEHYFENPFRVVFFSYDEQAIRSMNEILVHCTETSVTQKKQAWRKKLLKILLSYTNLGTERVRGWLTVCLGWALKDHDEELIGILPSHGSRLQCHERPFSGTDIKDLPLTFLRYLLQEPKLHSTLSFVEHPLMSAVYTEDGELYHILMEHIDVLQHHSLDFRIDGGRTMLHLSVGNRKTRFCQLLSEKLEVDVVDRRNNTPLHHAAYYDALVNLLQQGANPNRKNHTLPGALTKGNPRGPPKFAWTPLHIAAYRGFGAIVDKLLDGGADSSILDREGLTPLDAAMQNVQTCLSFKLLGRGFSFTPGTERSSRILAQAHSECRYDVVERLGGGGASPPESLIFIDGHRTAFKP